MSADLILGIAFFTVVCPLAWALAMCLVSSDPGAPDTDGDTDGLGLHVWEAESLTVSSVEKVHPSKGGSDA